MGWGASTSLRFSSLEDLHAQWDARLQAGFDQCAQLLEATAAMKAPIEEGALQLSVYTNSPNIDNYDAAAGAVRAVGKPNYWALPKIEYGKPPAAVVGVAANHGAPINFGFMHNFIHVQIAAQPFWTEAVEETKPLCQEIMLAAVRGEKVFG